MVLWQERNIRCRTCRSTECTMHFLLLLPNTKSTLNQKRYACKNFWRIPSLTGYSEDGPDYCYLRNIKGGFLEKNCIEQVTDQDNHTLQFYSFVHGQCRTGIDRICSNSSPHPDICFTEFMYFSKWLKYMNSVKHIKRRLFCTDRESWDRLCFPWQHGKWRVASGWSTCEDCLPIIIF